MFPLFRSVPFIVCIKCSQAEFFFVLLLLLLLAALSFQLLLSLPQLIHRVVSCLRCLLLFICRCRFLCEPHFRLGTALWIFVSHVLLRFRTFFLSVSGVCFHFLSCPIVCFFSRSRHFHQTTWVYAAAMSISKHKKCTPRLRCKVETYQVIKSSMAFWGNAFIYIYKKKQQLLHWRLVLACVCNLMPEVQSVFCSVCVCVSTSRRRWKYK